MDPTEERVRRAQAGDEAAFSGLVRDVYPQVYRWSLMQTGAPDDAEDVAQAAIVRMHGRLREFRHDSRFTTWLYAIVRRSAADWRRSLHRRRQREQRYGAESPRVQPAPVLTGDVESAIELVQRLLRDLPTRQREVFDLAELQAIPLHEVATLLGLRPSTVRVHLHRARRAIRGRLLERAPHLLEDL